MQFEKGNFVRAGGGPVMLVESVNGNHVFASFLDPVCGRIVQQQHWAWALSRVNPDSLDAAEHPHDRAKLIGRRSAIC